MHKSLAGIRVVAVEQAVAAPLCTRHLADLGADVIKVERQEEGDFARAYDDFVEGESSHFVWLNRGKRSIALDLKSTDGARTLRRLLEQADVLVTNLAPGAFERIISDQELDQLPRLIRAHISGYGKSGPYAQRKAYDLLVQGEAGVIAATGTPEQKARPGVSLADLAGGTYALSSILAALVEREHTGVGQRVDIALFDVLLEWMSPLLLTTQYTGHTPNPAGRGHASITPYGPYRTSDGSEIQIAVQNDGQWSRLCSDVLHRPDLATNESLATNGQRLANRAKVEKEVAFGIASLTSGRVAELLEGADVPYGILNEVADVLSHPQAAANNRWTTAMLSGGRQARVVAPPFLSGDNTSADRVVPTLGQHTSEILAEIDASHGSLIGK